MDLVHLRHFLAVARNGSFTAGARSLQVGRSTVSEARPEPQTAHADAVHALQGPGRYAAGS